MDETTVRDEVKDSIRAALAVHYKIDDLKVDADLVANIADVVFDSLSIEPKEQDYFRESGCFVWITR